ncbi:hypothetical protein [Roseibium sp. MB-4]
MLNGKATQKNAKKPWTDHLLGKSGIGLVLFIAVALANTNARADQTPLVCDSFKDTSQFVTARINNLDIAGAELQFPEDYLFSRPFKSGEDRDGLLLRADAKDFSSYPEAKQLLPNGGSKLNAGIRDYVQILISAYLPMPVIFKAALTNKYKAFAQIDPGSMRVNYKTVQNGLRTPAGYSADGFLKDDIFFQEDSSGVTDVIVCSSASRLPNPGCRHTFEAGAYDVRITYGRAELPRWRALRDGTAKLLQCFTTKDPKQLP